MQPATHWSNAELSYPVKQALLESASFSWQPTRKRATINAQSADEVAAVIAR